MAILKNEDGKELILLCDCECDEGIEFESTQTKKHIVIRRI